MKLPAFSRIGPFKWRTVRSNRDDHDEAGYCDTDKYEIAVAKDGDLTDAEAASTLIHEWIHAVIHVHFPEITDDEELTRKIELIVMQIAGDNKTAIRSILKVL